MPKVERVLPIYLVALAIQFLHFTEEYVYGFQFRVTEIMAGMPPFNINVFLAFNMIAYCLFLLAGLGMYKGLKFPMIIVWFFAICVLGNEGITRASRQLIQLVRLDNISSMLVLCHNAVCCSRGVG